MDVAVLELNRLETAFWKNRVFDAGERRRKGRGNPQFSQAKGQKSFCIICYEVLSGGYAVFRRALFAFFIMFAAMEGEKQ